MFVTMCLIFIAKNVKLVPVAQRHTGTTTNTRNKLYWKNTEYNGRTRKLVINGYVNFKRQMS